jgi:CspA family cold shock protein
MAHGTVKFFKPDKGWGAITSPDLPDGFDAWVHFSAIEMDGYRSLNPGDPVEFDTNPPSRTASGTSRPAPGSCSRHPSPGGPGNRHTIACLPSSCRHLDRAAPRRQMRPGARG